MQIFLKELAGNHILAGALKGTQVFRLLLDKAVEPQKPEIFFLDFTGVEVATASFLRESVLTFRDIIRNKRSNLYPVIANPEDSVRDELEEMLRVRHDTMILCKKYNNQVIESSLMGELDPKQKLTFNLVRQYGETDASFLMRNYGESEKIQQTAWNNRLNALVSKGLIMEITQGRAKLYKPLF